MSKQNHIFATRSDLEPGLRSIESQMPLKYIEMYLYVTGRKDSWMIVPHESPEFKSYTSLLAANRLGINLTGQSITGDNYLVVDAATEIRIREVPQRKGGVNYIVDDQSYLTAIFFRPGGFYQDHCLISGNIGTASVHPQSIELYNNFTRAVTKGFKKIGNYRVGPEALCLMENGMRMVTIGINSPREYDLKFQ